MRSRRSPLSRFLYIHGPDVGGCAFLVTMLAMLALDYAYQPTGFVRYVVAVISYAFRHHS